MTKTETVERNYCYCNRCGSCSSVWCYTNTADDYHICEQCAMDILKQWCEEHKDGMH